jgi:hypothetical protein
MGEFTQSLAFETLRDGSRGPAHLVGEVLPRSPSRLGNASFSAAGCSIRATARRPSRAAVRLERRAVKLPTLRRREKPWRRAFQSGNLGLSNQGLDMPDFQTVPDDEIHRQRVRERIDGALRSHLRVTPGFHVNGCICDVSGGVRALADRVGALL